MKKKEKMRIREEDQKEIDILSKLPIDISFDILSRFPLNSILQWKRVSKTWYNLIKHPRFAILHYTRIPSPSYVFVFDCFGYLHLITYKFSSNNPFEVPLTTIITYKLEFKEFDQVFGSMRVNRCKVVGSVNGLICIDRGFNLYNPCPYYICNPITQDHITLPNSHNIWIGKFSSGFGFDSISNEYKVVRISVLEFSKSRAEVYTFGLGNWREIKADLLSSITSMEQSNVFLNGAIYWLAFINDFTPAIVSFNVATEEFDIIKLSSDIQKIYKGGWELAVLKDYLYLIDGNPYSRFHKLWVMKDHGVQPVQDSWIQDCSIRSQKSICLEIGRNEMMNVEKSELVLLNSKIIGYYNHQNKTVRLVVMDKSRSSIMVGVGSLISPKDLCDSVKRVSNSAN
ncbi:F-box protein [Thalictrum thalictroides]|uniref:F-box protein n=1 Tax=Thalictrum thalictroides TaxID=46969 RepID=A0A7J6X0G0_THATH|nr:F-box protein [Thalictrum thalictroides]